MPNKIWIPTSQWILLSVAGLFIAARFYAKTISPTPKHPVRSYIADACVILAWLSFMAVCVTSQLLYKFGLFDDDESDFNAVSVPILKVGFISNVFYWPCLYLVKIAMLFFFDGVVEKRLLPIRWWFIRGVGVVTIIAFLFSIGFTLFLCEPISVNWDPDAECSSRGFFSYNLAGWVLHMVTDTLVYAIGFSLLGEMRNLPIREKLGAAMMFALGFVGIIVSAFMFWVPADYFQVLLWRALEQATLIIITCIPSSRILLTRLLSMKKRKMERISPNATSEQSKSRRTAEGTSNMDLADIEAMGLDCDPPAKVPTKKDESTVTEYTVDSKMSSRTDSV